MAEVSPVSTEPAPSAAPSSLAGDFANLGVEEELHVVDRATRELVADAPRLLEQLPADSYSDELQRSVVETNTAVRDDLSGLREELVAARRRLVAVAAAADRGVVAAGTVPLVDPLRLAVTPTTRYQRMLDDYQVLVREQLICGAQVHVQIGDRDLAVAIAQRVTPFLPTLLALSASSPYWMGEDSGYASMRSLLWQRWPTAGLSGEIASAAEHQGLIDDLIASGTITDAGMIYFDVRPSQHLPTLELRVTDACPDLDDVLLLAGLFRALVRHQRDHVLAGTPPARVPAPLLRSALWRAARSGLEGDLLHLPHSPRPVPAAEAVGQLLRELGDQLDEAGDRDTVTELATRALAGGSSAARQRAAYARRGRLSDVVDLLIETTDPDHVPAPWPGTRAPAPPGLPAYRRPGDEVLPETGTPPRYQGILSTFESLGAVELRARDRQRGDEQRSRGVTFGVGGAASGRLAPIDLFPRLVSAPDWEFLTAALAQRARALNAFLHDVYAERAVVRDGVVPGWVIRSAPGLSSAGALVAGDRPRAAVAGMDLVRDGDGHWFVLEDNLRVPSGLGYAVQNRRLSQTVLPDLPHPESLLDVEPATSLLLGALRAAGRSGAADEPRVVLLSEGADSGAWFEHNFLAGEMGVPLAFCSDLLVDSGTVWHLHDGARTRVDVLYLRMDEDQLLHSSGADGRPLAPALLAAVGTGRVALANAPGNGVGDDKAVYGFVPAMIDYYLNEKPLLASVPTFLCGVEEQLDQVLGRIGELVLKPVDGYGGQGVLIGPLASEKELAATRRQVEAAPHRWIAQELVQLSTHPCFDGNGLVPRHVDLRAFVFSSGPGAADIRVAPAALTRTAPAQSMVVNSSRGGGSKDTWVMGGAG